MGAFSFQHWVMVIIVVLLIFGAGRLGEVGKGLGEGIRNFKKGLGASEDPEPEASKRISENSPGDAKS